MRVEVITDSGTFAGLNRVWNGLLAQSRIHHPFMTHEWLGLWLDSFGERSTPYVMTVVAGSRILAVAPMMVTQTTLYGCPVRRLHGMVNAYSERFDWLLGEHPSETCRLLWDHLKEPASSWDILEVGQLPAESALLEFLPPLMESEGYLLGHWQANHAPYVSVRHSWETYYRSLKKAHRSNLRNHARQLEQHGLVDLELVTSHDRLELDIREALALEAVAWKVRQRTSLKCRRESQGFYQELLRRAAGVGTLHLSFLRVNGKRIAVRISLLHDNRLFMLKSGYDERYQRYSPGQVLTERLLRHAWDAGLEEVDFLGHDERWKQSWATGRRSHTWLFAFPDRMKTRLLHNMKFRVIPGLRRSTLFPTVQRTIGRLRMPVHGQ